MDKAGLIAHLKAKGCLKSKAVERALERIPRENFVMAIHKEYAYEDVPLPIPAGQTISAPHMYAMMLELAGIKKGEKVLEVGTGSGYGAALISCIIGPDNKAFSIEIIHEVAEFAKSNLRISGIRNVEVIEGDGNLGIPKEAPFDKIIVTAAARSIPEALASQLIEGGKIIIPVGGHFAQELLEGTKRKGKIDLTSHGRVMFVPMAQKEKSGNRIC